MENRDLGEPLGKKINHDPNKGPDFSYPFDNPNFGARSYSKDEIIIYEIEIPLSIHEYYQVTEEEIREKNQSRQDTLPAAMIDDISHQKQEIDTIHDHFEAEVLENFITLYNEIEPYRIQVLDIILQRRFLQNAQAGGKLQRLAIDTIYSQNKQIDDSKNIIEFLENEIEKIVIADIRGPIYGVNLLGRDEQLIKKYIQDYTQQFIKNSALGTGNNYKTLQ